MTPALGRFAALLLVVVAGAATACSGARDSGEPASAAPAGWERGASMSLRRSYVAAAQVGRNVYVAGGMVGETGRPLAAFARYAIDEDRWRTLEPLPVPTRSAAAAALGGAVYVAGGTTAAGDTAAAYAWNPGRGWRAVAPLPEPRFNHGAAAVDGRVYALGGLDRRGRPRAEVFAYDPRDDRWSRAAPLPRRLHAFGVVAFRGELWVVGGRAGDRIVRDVWVYSPRRDRWRRGPSMPRPMELLGLAAAGGRLHAVWESTHQVLDVKTGRWSYALPTAVTRHALRLFAFGERLAAIGGCTTALHDTAVVEVLRLGSG